MSEDITISVTVQIERLGEQFVRARPLGPWRAQAVGASASECCRKIEKRLERLLPKSLPTSFFESALPPDYQQSTTAVDLKPPERGSTWVEPIRIDLDTFRWQLPNGQCVVRMPAVSCELFGAPDELNQEEVERQARIALTRTAEKLNLIELRQRFCARDYDFQALEISVPLSVEAEKQETKRNDRKRTSTLRTVASDLTEARLQPVYGMDSHATELAEYFSGESPQSVLLVGPAGVGKSSLVHRLVTMRNDLGLESRKIWSTSGARIVSGMSGLGMWQQRCSKLIRQAHATNAIIHFGSLFELMEAGKIDGQPGVASMVRNSIGRRRLLAIAECTPEQLAIVERDDPLLLRVFSRYDLKEPAANEVLSILRQAANATQGNAFTEQAVEELYRLHSRFASYSALPAVALRLMRTMDEDAKQDEKFGAEDVARSFSKQTGLPRFLVDDSIKLDLEMVRRSLSEHVIGQQEPVDLIVDLIATLKARLVRPGRPLASLMFIGPTGVGKTEMAKAIARLLYSDTSRMLRIDMSEYASPWSASKLIGKPGEGDGTLTSPIREQPFSVVLLDEFEKADNNVFDLLLQVLGEGRLTDSKGRLADFRNSVVIMTSNLGAESFREASFGFGNDDVAGWRDHFQRELRKFVRPEFLGRIDRIVPFEPLPREIVRKIAQRELDLLRVRNGLKYSESVLEFEPEAIDLLCELGYQPKYGARPLRRAIEEHVTVPLANALSHLNDQSTWKFNIGAAEGEIRIQSEKLSTKTESVKEKEAEVINSWQQLAAMSRAARRSSPLRSLENDVERTSRQNILLRKKLKTADGPRRIAALKEDLVKGEATIEIARRIKAKLFEITKQINAQHLELMLAWHRNQTIQWAEFKQDGRTKMSLLRQVIEDVLKGRVTESNFITLLITGQGRQQLEIVWKAYESLAEQQGWLMDKYLVRPYDPLLDKDSSEHRKRISEKKPSPALTAEFKPVLRLLSSNVTESGEQQKACDLFRASNDDEFRDKLAWASGFGLQIGGEGVGGWLENEHGTIHFFDHKAAGAKRRVRLKVSVFEGRLLSIELPSDWLDPVSTPERDPLRTVNVSEQAIVDHNGKSVTYSQGKQSAALAELITDQHEQALWRAIGYNGIPREAQLHKELEVPF